MIEFDLKLCGSRMRQVRKEMFEGTVKEFCDKFEFSSATMYDCENGKIAPRPYVVVGVCREFGVSADWLLGLKEEM